MGQQSLAIRISHIVCHSEHLWDTSSKQSESMNESILQSCCDCTRSPVVVELAGQAFDKVQALYNRTSYVLVDTLRRALLLNSYDAVLRRNDNAKCHRNVQDVPFAISQHCSGVDWNRHIVAEIAMPEG